MKSYSHSLNIILNTLLESKSPISKKAIKNAINIEGGNAKNDFDNLINYLIEENYIRLELDSITIKYFITKQGEDFYSTGGYSSSSIIQLKREAESKNPHGNGMWIIMLLGILGTIATAIAIFLEHAKIYN